MRGFPILFVSAVFSSSACNSANVTVSACGGFEQDLTASSISISDYCDSEIVRWSFGDRTRTLSILDQRALLDCCGKRTADYKWDESTLVVTETDSPDPARCKCGYCPIDFKIEVDFEREYSFFRLKLIRDVTDAITRDPSAQNPKTILDENVFVSARGAEYVVDRTQYDWCANKVNESGY